MAAYRCKYGTARPHTVVAGSPKRDPMPLALHKVKHAGKRRVIIKIVIGREELYVPPLRNGIGIQYIADNTLVLCAAYDGIVLYVMLFHPCLYLMLTKPRCPIVRNDDLIGAATLAYNGYKCSKKIS